MFTGYIGVIYGVQRGVGIKISYGGRDYRRLYEEYIEIIYYKDLGVTDLGLHSLNMLQPRVLREYKTPFRTFYNPCIPI